MEVGRLAQQKGLSIAAGTQRRHSKDYQETIRRIHDGAIGEIVYGRCYWDGNEIWVIRRQPGWSDMEWQIRNWPYFTWLSGDHIVEQHVHNLDVMNWVMGEHPLRVIAGLGGRQVRTGQEYGQIFDHFAIEFEYSGDRRMFSQCRQINGCGNVIEEAVVGTLGTSNCKDRHPRQARPGVALSRQGAQCLPSRARGPGRQHSRRQPHQRRPGRCGEHHDRHHRA